MSQRADADALDAAVAALRPDQAATPALRDAEALARRLEEVAEIAPLASTIARTLAAWGSGEVEPHHAQWRLASAVLTLRQELARIDGGGAVSPIALAGAIYELEVLFPRAPESAAPPRAEDLELLPPTSLVRRGPA